jgi:hypothetical protein
MWLCRCCLPFQSPGAPINRSSQLIDSRDVSSFRPGNNGTRGQIAKIVWEAAGYGGRWFSPSGGQTFEDVPPSSPFYEYIEGLTQEGVMSGYACGSTPTEPCVGPGNRPYFRPGNNATRGQVAKIVNNTFFPNCQDPGPSPGLKP